jgi:hypothetical protein
LLDQIDFYNDTRYIDIGDLLTGFAPYEFKSLYIRPFTVSDLIALAQGSVETGSRISHVIRTVNCAISEDVGLLTDGDFEYVMAGLRIYSYPKTPNQVHWTCKKPVVVPEGSDDNLTVMLEEADTSDRDLKLKNLVRRPCDNRNVEIVHNVKMDIHSLKDDDLVIPYSEIDFPRVATLNDYFLHIKEHPEDKYAARVARWLKAGTTLAEKMKLLNSVSTTTYNRIIECQTRYYHGISESMTLKCRVCRNTVPYKSTPDLRTFFAGNSEQNILDIQYTLLSDLKLQPDLNMPAKALLFYYSSLAKDKQQEQERENLRKATRRKGR